MAWFNYRHFVSSALLVKSALSVSGDSAAGTIDGHVVGVVEDGGAVSPHLSRNLELDLFDRVGDSGRCTDYDDNPYNTITAVGTSVLLCATACATKPRSYQVGFEFLSPSSCSCLYSAGNVPEGQTTGVTDATGKYAVLSSTTGVTGLSCYKVKDIEPKSVNSFAEYSTRSIVKGDTIDADDTLGCSVKVDMSGFDCHLSYEAIEGALLVSKVQSGKCDTTANAAFIAGPMPLDAGTSTAVGDTVTVSGITQHNLAWKNTGNTAVYPYCIRADVLDLMSMESVASKKVEIEASISYKQDGEFATPTGFSIVEANETVAESSATKKVFVMAKGGLCNVTDSTPPGGNYLTICVYLEGASDAAMDDLKQVAFFANGQEVYVPVDNGNLNWLTKYTDNSTEGFPSSDNPLTSFSLDMMIPSEVLQKISAAGGAVEIIGLASITYATTTRRDLRERNLQETKKFRLVLYLGKDFYFEDKALAKVAITEIAEVDENSSPGSFASIAVPALGLGAVLGGLY